MFICVYSGWLRTDVGQMLHRLGPDGSGMTCREHRIRESVSVEMDGRVTTACAGLAKVHSDRFFSQLIRRKRRVGEREITTSDVGLDGVIEGTMRGMLRKRALLGPEYSVSVSSVSDVAEARAGWLPADEFPEGAWSTRVDLADVTARLQKEVEDFWAESGYGGYRECVAPPQPSGWSSFTSSPVPMFAGKTSWDQYSQVFEAIVSSNGWDGVTAALQLVSHLEGDALNVALLVPAPRRVVGEFC